MRADDGVRVLVTFPVMPALAFPPLTANVSNEQVLADRGDRSL